jgi:predicted ATP-binding protein involved in virulence
VKEEQIANFKIEEILLKNYKKYDDDRFQFKSRFSLLVGENATGKTTVLDGVATAIGGFLQGFKNIKSGITHTIGKKDVKMIINTTESGIVVSLKLPTEIEGKFNINNSTLTLKRSKKSMKSQVYLSKKENKEIISLIEELEKEILDGGEAILPIFSYHGTGRLWEQEKKKASKMELLQRLDGYNESLEAKSNYRNFLSWFEKLARAEFNTKKENPILKSVKEVIIKALEELTNKKIHNIDYREQDLEIYYDGTEQVDRVGQMSDGYRNIIGMVSDIAYRICILNPNLKDNIEKTPGIVLIDEIDLHLHPKWQRKIIGILKSIFPKVQFIATSHSPFIIQSMEQNEIIRLDDKEILMANGSEMSIEDISESIMRVELPQMSERKLKMLEAADKYFDLLEKLEKKEISEEEVKKYKEELDKLEEPFEENMAYVAFLRRKRLVNEAKRMK